MRYNPIPLVRSVWDCYTSTWPGTLGERSEDALKVIIDWIKKGY